MQSEEYSFNEFLKLINRTSCDFKNEINDKIYLNDTIIKKNELRSLIKRLLNAQNIKSNIVQQRDDFYEKFPNKVNFLHEIYCLPTLKNNLSIINWNQKLHKSSQVTI